MTKVPDTNHLGKESSHADLLAEFERRVPVRGRHEPLIGTKLSFPSRDSKDKVIPTARNILILFGGSVDACEASQLNFTKVPHGVYDLVIALYDEEAETLHRFPLPSRDDLRILPVSEFPQFVSEPFSWNGQWLEVKDSTVIAAQQHLDDRGFKIWNHETK